MKLRPGTIRSLSTAMVVVFMAASASAAAPSRSPLPEGFLLAGVDGRLAKGSTGAWTFTCEKTIATDSGSALAGQEIELLPSTTLEYMLGDLGTRESMELRLWGTVTLYRGENRIFPSYYLQMVPRTPTEPPADSSHAAAEANTVEPRINDSNDEIRIPEQLIKELQATRRVVDIAPSGAAATAPDQSPAATRMQTGDAMLADRLGVIVRPEKDAAPSFRLDGLGRSVGTLSMRVLPCETLERIESQRSNTSLAPVRYRIAGIVTHFKGDYYILPTRLVRAYDYGNLTN
jgi:hypothetical protein